MDLEFLVKIVASDIRRRTPSAEKALRAMVWNGDDSWSRINNNATTRKATRAYPKTSDPEGIMRSLKSNYCCNVMVGHYAQVGKHVR
jgi:hypothetical protein